ncbi:RNA-directed DNA polymerase from mobile element jockey [Labeo rohita]|uniref:RNA-directed DNA polymerase from mobile element jockey n=1 Tax=Labeo rohita TaxID=84645 RepID=A0ABQ8LEW0_LABRO|nr:RNA-directed DNA polymerase from mobile element jockey [Labeo rohita]
MWQLSALDSSDWRKKRLPGPTSNGGRDHRISLGSSQPVRWCPAMACLLHWLAFWLTRHRPGLVHWTHSGQPEENGHQTTCHCSNTYWLALQQHTDARGTYEGIKKAIGPKITKIAPLKSKTGKVITDQKKQLQLSYLELYETQNIPLHELLCQCYDQGHIHQDMHDANIVTVYKNKEGHSDCNNYWGISLLNIVGKAFARVTLVRLQTLVSHIYPESQCGFRAGRVEQQMAFYIAFIDLTKAFDLVSRSRLFRFLQKISCSPQLHDNMRSTVCFNGATSESFLISSRVKQGCVLMPTLFSIFFSVLQQYVFKDCSEADDKLFNIAHIRVLIREMLFADDEALTSHSEDDLQQLFSRFSYACKEFGLTISLKKTKVMAQEKDSPPTIAIDGSLSIIMQIKIRIANAAAVMARLNLRVWNNTNLTVKTKL